MTKSEGQYVILKSEFKYPNNILNSDALEKNSSKPKSAKIWIKICT